jgi:chromate transporter
MTGLLAAGEASRMGSSGTRHEIPSPNSRARRLGELALNFLKIGAVAFGGPPAHIAMMEEEFVRRRGWVDHQRFLDMIGAVNLLPGPNSTELALYIGLMRAGWLGLVVAGVSFILPSAVLVLALAWAYVRFGALPQVTGVLYGTKPVVIVVVLQALWTLGRTAIKSVPLAVLVLLDLALLVAGVHPIVLLLGTGVVLAMVRWWQDHRHHGSHAASSFAIFATASGTAAGVSIAGLFFYFMKVGVLLFGSGFLLLAFLRADLVAKAHWLTEAQLLDAIAVSQATPGPLSTVATFIGYVLAGWTGAISATAGIFLPAFLLVAMSGWMIPRLRQSRLTGAFLDGVNAAALALMAAVTWQLGRASVIDIPTVALAIVSALLLFRFRVNSAWLMLGGAVAGLAATFFRFH